MPTETADVQYRRAGRVLLVHRDRVLLLHGSDPYRPEAGSWWFTVGGGCEGNESTAEAARREAFEETGFVLADLGPVVLHRTAEFDFEGSHCVQTEDFYLATVDSDLVVTTGWTDLERRSVAGYRWWSLAELAATDEAVYPQQLVALLTPLIEPHRLS